ncbi:unnamed protein product [Penicillium salamii]|uniref:Uncharacterized protein n=1 Tax=Penicillium salamii TaxID=1612424 RepID=A0A9W4IXK7_9EURO|nr:unnamed protein product [Penicillium salamii]
MAKVSASHLSSRTKSSKVAMPINLLKYLLITNHSRYNHFFSCNICLKLRPRNAFADKQLQAKRRKDGTQKDRRFCLDCGCCNKMYQPGHFLKVNGRDEVLCAMCRERCRYGRYCTRCRMCEPCISKLPPAPVPSILISEELEDRCPQCWLKAGDFAIDLGKPPGEFQLEDMLMAMKMSEFESDYGFTGSPEWFEEDIAHGNF